MKKSNSEKISSLLTDIYFTIHASGNKLNFAFDNNKLGTVVSFDPVPIVSKSTFKNTGHIQLPFKYLGLVFPPLFGVPFLVIHFLNRCVIYTPTFSWIIGGFYIWFFFCASLNMLLRDSYTWYCVTLSAKNHMIYEALLCSALATSLGLFDMYTIFNSPIAAMFSFFALMAAARLYASCFLNRHYRRCRFRGHDHIQLTEGDLKRYMAAFYFCDVIWVLSMFAMLGLSFAYVSELNSPLRPVSSCKIL